MHPLWQFDSNLHIELVSCLNELRMRFFSAQPLAKKRVKNYLLVLKGVTSKWNRVINVRILFRLVNVCVKIGMQCAWG